MLAIVLTMVLGTTSAGGERAAPYAMRLIAAEVHSALLDALTEKLKSMNDADQGVFHDDVTSIVAPYFPSGQPFAETERVLAEQKLGPLRHFHGQGDSTGSSMYVSHADLMSTTFSDVSVVVDFDFTGKTERDMTLKSVRAFLQAPSM